MREVKQEIGSVCDLVVLILPLANEKQQLRTETRHLHVNLARDCQHTFKLLSIQMIRTSRPNQRGMTRVNNGETGVNGGISPPNMWKV